MTKVCTKCQVALPLDSYTKSNDSSSGLKAQCRECRAKARREARGGWAPDHSMVKTVPEGFHVKGISTLYNAQGEVAAQWVKSQADREQQIENLFEAVQDIAKPFKGASKPVKVPKVKDKDLLTVYPFGDPHFGMHAWAAEAGDDFDLKIAERDLVTAVDHLVDLAPPSENALIISLGDMFHSDSQRNETTRGTRVDVDGRWAKVLSVGIRAMRRCIDRALEKHTKVSVICATGNHDDHTSLVLAIALGQYYENEPRVAVNLSPSRFYWHRFGSCLLGVHHGDTAKAKDLPGIMACDRAKDWGETHHRMFYCGHVHHESVKEYPGVVIETFRTLAPKDAWHAGQGYRSGQDLRMDVWHKEYGRVNRHIVGIQQIRKMVSK